MRTLAWWLRVVRAGAVLQITRGRGGNFLLAAVVTPVLYGATLVLVARYFGRTNELAPFVVVGPAILGIWQTAILTGAEIVSDERGAGTLELLVAAPAPTELLVLGRIAGNTLLSLISVPVVLLMARLLGAELAIRDPFAAALAVLCLALSTLAISLVYSSTFVLARSTRVFQNVIGFPAYIVSGIAFPIALLPSFIQPISAVVSLTWAASLLRASFHDGADGVTLTSVLAMLALTVLYGGAGHVLFSRIERSIRRTGKVSLAA